MGLFPLAWRTANHTVCGGRAFSVALVFACRGSPRLGVSADRDLGARFGGIACLPNRWKQSVVSKNKIREVAYKNGLVADYVSSMSYLFI
jgi:hypothetical protein